MFHSCYHSQAICQRTSFALANSRDKRRTSLTNSSSPCSMALLRQPWPLWECVPGWGCFPQEHGGFTEVECGHLRAAKLFSAHHCCLVPLLSPSKKKIDNQKMREKWGTEGSRHLNVIKSMRRGKVKVSSCPCVYCCLHIDLFPDT